MMRVLVTGFEPYQNESENASWEVARGVADCKYQGAEVVCVQLPVSFHRVGAVLHRAIEQYLPDCLLMLGQSGGSDKVKLERLAINMMDAKSADNDGFAPDEETISEEWGAALFSHVPVKKLCNAIAAEGIPVKISNSCGLYVCNRLYFEALTLCKSTFKAKALFVHLPYYVGQPSAKADKSSLPLEEMIKAIQIVIFKLDEENRKVERTAGESV